ncbi:hypothetical protein Tco_1050768 [Tanacetum coccineum]
MSCHYTLDEETYLVFLHKNGEEIDIFAFIHTPNPTKVRVVKRERNEDEPRLLDTTVGRTVPLLLVAPDRAESELEASVERLFDKGVVEVADTVVEDTNLVQSRRQGKRKSMVVDAGGASHPPKTLREDHGTPGGTSVGGKSHSMIKRLLVGAMLNAEVGVVAIPTLPFVTTSISSMPEREVGDHTDSMAKPNLRTIGASQRFVISSDSSHHSGPTITEAEVDSLVRSSALIMTIATTVTSTVDPALIAKEKPVKPSLFFADSSSAGAADPNTGVFSDLTGSDFLVGGIRTVIDPDTDLQKVYVPQWSVTNGSRLDDGRVCREMVDEFAPPKFFASVRGMEHDQLFTEFNVGAARQMSLSAEVRMRAEYNVKERRRRKIVDLKAQLLLKETKVAKATHLCAQTSNLEAVEKSLRDEVNALKERNTILEKEQNALDVKVTDLEVSVVGKERDLTDLNAQLTSVKSQNDNLVDRVHELEISLPDSERKSWFAILADAPGMNDLQPDIEQLKLPIHRSEDQVVLGETSLSFSLSVSHSHVKRIMENITAQRSALVGVWTPLSKPLFVTSLMDDYEIVGVGGQKGAGTDGQAVADGNVAPFPNVDDVELNIPQ